jgi:hypothetical protein
LAVNLFRSGSGRFQKSDMDPGPDPVKNRPDPQHWIDVVQLQDEQLVTAIRLEMCISHEHFRQSGQQNTK